MDHFLVGAIFGFLLAKLPIKKKNKKTEDAGVQASEPPPPTQPILIQNSKPRYIPYLVNFWGPDS
jgi:hypothetical protein